MSGDIRSKKYVRLFYEQSSLYEQYARQNDLQGKDLYILMWIYNNNGITQKYISQKTYLIKQVVNITIKNLLKNKYIYFEEDKNDKRKKLIKLTETGKKYAASILEPLEKYEEEAISILSSEEQEIFFNLYKKYNDKLKEKLIEGESI